MNKGDQGRVNRKKALAMLRHSFERVAKLPDDVWDEVRPHWELRKIEEGQVLTRQGQTERSFSLILHGLHRLYFTTPDGDDHTLAFAYPPDYSGVPDSFFLQQPSDYALEALTGGYILAIGYNHFSPLLQKHKELEHWARQLFLTALSGRLRRERQLVSMTAEERYQRLLRESPQILQIASLKHIASYLGMSPETLSRVRSQLS